MKKPKLIRRCPAAAHAAEGERIVEFTFHDGTGGLMSMRKVDGRSRLEIYRTDGEVDVVAPRGALLQDPDVKRVIGALQWLLDDMHDAGHTVTPSGKPFDSVAHAAEVMASIGLTPPAGLVVANSCAKSVG